MIRPAQMPHPLPPSMFYYGAKLPDMRAAEIPGMCSVRVQDFFPDIPDPIHQIGEDTDPVRAATEAALANVDMSMIQPGETINIMCSEHGFALMNGDAYAEVLKTIRRIVIERTGATRIRLVMGAAGTKFEQLEIIPRFGLDEAFEGHVHSFGPNDRGIPIETEIGTIYGVRRPFMAQRLIHVHYDDPRELHFHRVNGRSLKSFTMSYARIETRSVFHNNFPTRSANIIPRAIYESKFIRDKWAFAAVLSTTPAGTATVLADNDLMRMDRSVALNLLQNYGKMIELFRSIDECFTIHDDTRWMFYQHAGGLCACTLYESSHDHLDLELPKVRTPSFYDRRIVKDPVKAVLINAAWKFPPCAAIMIGADPEVGGDLASMSPTLPNQQLLTGKNLPDAFNMAVREAGTDKAIVFDGSYGAINMTVPLAEYLLEKAPEVARRVEQELLPKWLRQRNLTPGNAPKLTPA